MKTEISAIQAPAIEIAPFDPYAAALPLRWFRKVPTVYMLLLAPIVAVLLTAAAAISGLLGGASDFQPVRDIQLAIGRGSLPPADPFRYPLTRDIVVWIFAVIMVIEVMIMHRQWKLFASALPRLAKNKVFSITPGAEVDSLDDAPTLKWLAQIPPEQRFARYVRQVNERNARRARLYTIAFSVIALTLAALLVWAERDRVFRVFTPRGMTAGERANWRLAAYHNWWASLNHPVGVAVYYLLVALSIYVIITQTHVGMNAARIASALPRLAHVDANWVNPDGDYGWGPLHEIFGTVWSSMALYGLMVSLLAVVLGLGGVGWIPACLWFVLVTIYFAVPWFALRKIEATAKERHIDIAQAEVLTVTTKDQDELEARVKRYREARIRPMRLGHFQGVSVALSVLLPVVLNLIQPFIQSFLTK